VLHKIIKENYLNVKALRKTLITVFSAAYAAIAGE
jgi:hypothetical protein